MWPERPAEKRAVKKNVAAPRPEKKRGKTATPYIQKGEGEVALLATLTALTDIVLAQRGMGADNLALV